MIVFEWFYDKAKIIGDELKKQEGYKVSMALCNITMLTCMQYIATGSCCKELNNGSGCLLSCKIARKK